jgi:hypothetical protein
VAAIAEVHHVSGANGPTLRVKMHDKIAALTALGRHLCIFKDHVGVEVSAAQRGEPINFMLVIEAPTQPALEGPRER